MEDAEYKAFCEAAGDALEREERLLLNNPLDRLSSLESTWHPNGFAVFRLDDDHQLGKLRLHIWPDNERVVRPDDAPIHTHVWHLCSRVLVGTYSETLYEKAGPESAKSMEYHSATIDYLVDKDSFTASNKAFLKPLITTRVIHGGLHMVPANVPHETLIGEGSFVATLLITSHPVSAQAIMYSSEEIQASTYDRPVLDQDQKTELIRRLEQELKSPAGLKN